MTLLFCLQTVSRVKRDTPLHEPRVTHSGGRGTLPGTLVGVLLLGTVGTALVFLKVLPQWEKVVQGAIILAAVAADGLQRRRAA